MRSLISTIFLVAVFGVASAQTDKGSWVVGGSADLSFTSIDGDNVFNFDVRGGHFLVDNFAGGINVSYRDGNDLFDLFEGRTFGIGPWVRYYFGGTFYVGIGYDFESIRLDFFDESAQGTELKLEAGYPIFIGGEAVALEPSLNYWIGGGDIYEDFNTFAAMVGFFVYF